MANASTARPPIAVGQHGTCHGYPATVLRQYSGSLWDIRVPGGVVCTDDFVPDPIAVQEDAETPDPGK